jgi:hypothetical protein
MMLLAKLTLTVAAIKKISVVKKAFFTLNIRGFIINPIVRLKNKSVNEGAYVVTYLALIVSDVISNPKKAV